MTLNGIVALILHYFTEFGSFWADYVKAVTSEVMYCGSQLFRILLFPAGQGSGLSNMGDR